MGGGEGDKGRSAATTIAKPHRQLLTASMLPSHPHPPARLHITTPPAHPQPHPRTLPPSPHHLTSAPSHHDSIPPPPPPGLPRDAKVADVHAYFSQYGEVAEVQLMADDTRIITYYKKFTKVGGDGGNGCRGMGADDEM